MLINQQILNKCGTDINNVYLNFHSRSVKKAVINQGKLCYSNQASDRSGFNLQSNKLIALRGNKRRTKKINKLNINQSENFKGTGDESFITPPTTGLKASNKAPVKKKKIAERSKPLSSGISLEEVSPKIVKTTLNNGEMGSAKKF